MSNMRKFHFDGGGEISIEVPPTRKRLVVLRAQTWDGSGGATFTLTPETTRLIGKQLLSSADEALPANAEDVLTQLRQIKLDLENLDKNLVQLAQGALK